MKSKRAEQTAATDSTHDSLTGVVLIIDDESSICELAREVLEEMQFRVCTAVKAEDALAMVRSDPHQFNLVILDLAMPTMNGEKLIRELHSLSPTLKLIISSGQQSKLPAEELYRLGVVALMPKPYGAKSLIRLVQSALGVPSIQSSS